MEILDESQRQWVKLKTPIALDLLGFKTCVSESISLGACSCRSFATKRRNCDLRVSCARRAVNWIVFPVPSVAGLRSCYHSGSEGWA